LCFGALMADIAPAVVKADRTEVAMKGTTFGMPHEQEWELRRDEGYPVIW